MLGLLRFATIVLGVLIFAVVFSVCGEGGVCVECVHACCAPSDRPDRPKDFLARLVSGCRACLQLAVPLDVALRPLLDEVSGEPSRSLILASKVAQLRV